MSARFEEDPPDHGTRYGDFPKADLRRAAGSDLGMTHTTERQKAQTVG